MSEMKLDGLPPVSMKNLMEAYKKDDAENGYGMRARLAREFFGKVFDEIRLQIDEVFDQLAVEGETPHYTYFCEPNGEITNDAFPIEMMTEPAGFVSVLLDDTSLLDCAASPIFPLIRLKKMEFTPLILDDLTPIVVAEGDTLFCQTPVFLPPVADKESGLDFEASAQWIPLLASYGITR